MVWWSWTKIQLVLQLNSVNHQHADHLLIHLDDLITGSQLLFQLADVEHIWVYRHPLKQVYTDLSAAVSFCVGLSTLVFYDCHISFIEKKMVFSTNDSV